MMNPLSSPAQIHSISIVIYWEIMHNSFTILPPCRDEPEKHFNRRTVFQSTLRTQPFLYLTIHGKPPVSLVPCDIYILLILLV